MTHLTWILTRLAAEVDNSLRLVYGYLETNMNLGNLSWISRYLESPRVENIMLSITQSMVIL